MRADQKISTKARRFKPRPPRRTLSSRHPPPSDAPENIRAQWWRQHIMGWTRRELAERSGYSMDAIQRFEMGYTSAGTPHGPAAWQRYRNACAAIMASRDDFDWLWLED